MKYGIRPAEGDQYTSDRYYQCHAKALLDEPRRDDEEDTGFFVDAIEDPRTIFRTVSRPWQLGRDVDRTKPVRGRYTVDGNPRLLEAPLDMLPGLGSALFSTPLRDRITELDPYPRWYPVSVEFPTAATGRPDIEHEYYLLGWHSSDLVKADEVGADARWAETGDAAYQSQLYIGVDPALVPGRHLLPDRMVSHQFVTSHHLATVLRDEYGIPDWWFLELPLHPSVTA